MAQDSEEKINPSTESEPVLIDLDDPNTKMSYANHTHMVVNSTDVALYFGVASDGISNTKTKLDSKVIINHASFVKMMEYWFHRYALLKRIYGDGPTTINDFDDHLVRSAFEEMYKRINDESGQIDVDEDEVDQDDE